MMTEKFKIRLVSMLLCCALMIGILPANQIVLAIENSAQTLKTEKVLFKDVLGEGVKFGGWGCTYVADTDEVKEGKASYKVDFRQNNYGNFEFQFDSPVAISEELRKTGGIHLWSKLPSKIATISIILYNRIDGKEYQNQYNFGPEIKDNEFGKWKELTIPFAKFSSIALNYENGNSTNVLFDWNTITKISISTYIKGGDESTTWTANFDDVSIVDGIIKLADKTVKLLPHDKYEKLAQKFTPIDIRSACNMGFADDVANDGKGGWADQGSSNDLRQFTLKGIHKMVGVPFNIIDPSTNNEKSCIVLRGQNNTTFPKSSEILINAKFAGIYMLHASAWIYPVVGRYRFVYEDGTETTIEIKNKESIANWWGITESDTMRVGWNGANEASGCISLYVAPFKNPKPDVTVKKIIAETDGDKAYLMIVGATLTDVGPYFPELTDRGNLDTTNWHPWSIPDTTKLMGSPLDASFVLETPAGKHGILTTVKDGKMYFEDGKEARFWGTALVAKATFLSHEDAMIMADRIAASGLNVVRLHHMDGFFFKPNIFGMGPGTRKLDPEQLDKVHFLINELKKRGIYIYMDLCVTRRAYAEDGAKSPEDVEAGYKIEGFFDPILIQLQKEYAKQLLTTVNPYTGLAPVNDPVVIGTDINNESHLTGYNVGRWDITTPYYQKQLQDLFNNWLVKKYKDKNSLKEAWQEVGATGLKDDEDPVKATVRIPADYATANYSKQRKSDILACLADTQIAYVEDFTKYLRSIGVKFLIAGHSNFLGNLIADTYTALNEQMIDRHFYYSLPNGMENKMVPGASSTQLEAMVKTPSLGLIGELASNNVFDKPLLITEFNSSAPNNYVGELQVVMSAFGAFQGWNPMEFAYSDEGNFINNYNAGYLNTWNDPLKISTYPGASILFHRQDVQEALTGYFYPVTDKDAMDVKKQSSPVDRIMSLITKTGMTFTGHQNGEAYNDSSMLALAEETKKTGKGTSITQELYTDTKQGLFTVNTPNTQAITGFTLGKKVSTDDIDVTTKTPFVSVMLNSLTNDPIWDSDKMLLTTVARSRNTGEIRTRDGSDWVYGGKAPTLLEPVTGDIVLKTKDTVEVYSLDSSGQRIQKLTINKSKEGFSVIPLTNENFSPNYEIIRTKKAEGERGPNPTLRAEVKYVKSLFNDLGNYPWAKQEINLLASKNFVSGTAENQFSPGTSVTRADFLNSLIKALDLKAEFTDNFEDVNTNDNFYQSIGIAKKLAITAGIDGKKFDPYAPILRQDMMVFLMKALKAANKLETAETNDSLDSFTDVSEIAPYALDSVRTLVKLGYVKGSGQRINPCGNTTRAEAAVLVYRLSVQQ